MSKATIEIEIYDKREFLTVKIHVEKISPNTFKTTANELFNCDLIYGTEFETRLNKDGKHEIVRIIRRPEFTTRKFLLTSHFKASEYQILADEILKHGGYWQVDFGSIATINLPLDSSINLDQLFIFFDFHPTEITD